MKSKFLQKLEEAQAASEERRAKDPVYQERMKAIMRKNRLRAINGFIAMGICTLALICSIGCFIWVVVSFLIYLFKDIPFDWASIYWTVGSFVTCILMYGYVFMRAVYEEAGEDFLNR